MELRHLRYFVAVGEELNFTRASERLHIAQPPLSRQIKQLEEELGVELLVRDRRRVLLTPAGTVFLQEVRNLLGQLQNSVEITRNAANQALAVVRLGISGGLGNTVFSYLEEYCKREPGLEIECKHLYSTYMNRALRERQIDIAFMRPPVATAFLRSYVLMEEPLQVLLPIRHKLASQEKVYMKELAEDSILLHDRATSTGVYDRIIELFNRAGISPKLINTHTGPYEEAGMLLVASGKGVALGVGAGLRQPAFDRDVVTVPIADEGATIEVHMAWRKGEDTKAVQDFVDFVRRRETGAAAAARHTRKV